MGVAERFGANVREGRRRIDVSQEQLGLAAELHRTEIGLLERGERVPRIDTVLKLAGALKVPAAQLLAGITWEPGHSDAGRFSVSSAKTAVKAPGVS